MIGVEDHTPGRGEIALALLHRGLEFQPLVRVLRRRDHFVELDATELDKRRTALRIDVRVGEVLVANRDGVVAVEIENRFSP
jgi:hypothetical protein